LLGTRGIVIARVRDIHPNWSASMHSHFAGIPKLANAIAWAFFMRALRDIARLDAVSTGWAAGRPEITRCRLTPMPLGSVAAAASSTAPLMQLPRAASQALLGSDCLHA
jgi:hypothetical protein